MTAMPTSLRPVCTNPPGIARYLSSAVVPVTSVTAAEMFSGNSTRTPASSKTYLNQVKMLSLCGVLLLLLKDVSFFFVCLFLKVNSFLGRLANTNRFHRQNV